MRKTILLLVFLFSVNMFTQDIDAKKSTAKRSTKSTASVKTVSCDIIDPEFMLYENSNYESVLEKYGFKLTDSFTEKEGAMDDSKVDVYEKDFDGQKVVISRIDMKLMTKYKIQFPNSSMLDSFLLCLTSKGLKKEKDGRYINKNIVRQATVDGLTVTIEYYIHNSFEDLFK